MAKIIAKNKLDDEVRKFLEELKEVATEEYLIIQIKEEKIVIQSLNGWLKSIKD